MLKLILMSALLMISGCSELSVFVADSLNKSDGDVTSVDVTDEGYLDIHWYARDRKESDEYDVYMTTAGQLPDSLAHLAVMGDADSSFTKFTSIKKSWNINPKSNGSLVGTVKGKLRFTYKEKLDSNLYYFFQVVPKNVPALVSNKGGIVRINLNAPVVTEVQSTENSFLFTWPVVEGASEYILYNKGNFEKVLFTAVKNQLLIRYDQLSNFQNICIRSKRGELVSDNCSDVTIDIPAVPVASVDLSGSYSTSSSYTVSWTNWPNSKINSHVFKTCSDNKCNENCTPSKETKDSSLVVTTAEGSAVYACVQVVDNRGIESAWVASAKTITVDTVPPVVSVGPDRITRTAIDIDANTSGASSWKWTVLSTPSTLATAEFSNPTQEDTRVTFSDNGVYRLRLTAKDAAGNQTHADLNVTMDTTSPVFAGISQIWRKSSTEVMLFWNPATDALSSSSQITYDVCVAAAGSSSCLTNFVVKNALGSEVHSSTVSGLTAGVAYEFLVRAKDAAGNINVGSSPRPVVELSGISQVVAGENHSCAIVDSDRSVRCWGKNNVGQLGDGTLKNRVSPKLVPGLNSVASLALGNNFSCALLSDGTVKCWGSNENGQLGLGDLVNRTSPVAIPSLTGIIGIGAGLNHACAVTSSGASVKCWGINNYYQMGDLTQTTRTSPVLVSSLTNVASIKVGGDHSCAIISPLNTVKCWGRNNVGQLGDSTNGTRNAPVDVTGLTGVTSLGLGADHACAIQSSNNRVRCWGYNNVGQIGDGTTMHRYSSTLVDMTYLGTASAVYVGHYSSCAVQISDAAVRCWGDNGSGQLGNGLTTNSSTPVTTLGVTNPQALAIGRNHACSLSSVDQTLRCWGTNDSGQLAQGGEFVMSNPVKTDLPAVAQVVASDYFNCAIMASDRSVQCWGMNSNGALGDGTNVTRSTPAPVSGLVGVKSIALGFYHGCAQLADDTVKCWGANGAGQVGDNTTTNRYTPVLISTLPAVRAIAASDWATCALIAADDTVRCWGDNSRWAVGDGTNTNRLVPTVVTGLSGVDRIYGGTFQHCAIMKSDRSIKCWGQNDNGVLGDGTTTTRPNPVTVIGLTGVKDLAMGIFHVCAIMEADGSLYCWGLNDQGQVGDGTLTNRYTPLKVPDLSGVSIVSGGVAHTCAVVGPERKVMCWGQNTSAELGTGSVSTRSFTPVTVVGLEGVEWLGAGRGYNCVSLVKDHEVRCWGGNSNGEMGVGNRIFSNKTASGNVELND